MGFREAIFLGFALLLSGGNPAAADQPGIPRRPEATAPNAQLPPQAERPPPPLPATSYRLKSSRLRKPSAVDLKLQGSQQLTSEQLQQQQQRGTLRIRGPDLNPPVQQQPKVQVAFKQRAPVSAASVAARCGEAEVTVEVKQDFLGNGQSIRPGDLTLGGCAALHAGDGVLRFQTELQGCGGTLTMTEDALIYSFSLMYSPKPIGGTRILKTNAVEAMVQCHYQRRHYVSSGAVSPTWKTFASSALAEQQLHFSLRLMTEDWRSPRPSSVYFLSDVMRIEAAAVPGRHVPLRVYVDKCVATVNPDPESEPRYPFIDNHGCFSGAKLTGDKSFFMQRSQEDKLHLQLKAFRFHQDQRTSIYITCHLNATGVSVPVDSRRKACSFLSEADRWVASGGDNEVCRCCETSCGEQRRRRRRLAADADPQWEESVALGPIVVEDEPAERLQAPRAASSVTPLGGVGAALAVLLLAFMGAAICSRLSRPAAHAVCT